MTIYYRNKRNLLFTLSFSNRQFTWYISRDNLTGYFIHKIELSIKLVKNYFVQYSFVIRIRKTASSNNYEVL